MIKLWICLAFIAGISSNAAYAESSEQDDVYDDYYLNDMDQDIYKTIDDIFKTTKSDLFMNLDNSKENNDDSEMVNYEDDKKFEEELENYVKNNKFDPKADGNLEDYQFEDNRSEVDVDLSNEGEDGILARPLSAIISNEAAKEENLNNTKELSTDLSKVQENVDKSILDETKSILNEDTINEFTDKTAEASQVTDDNSDIFEETSKILDESYASEKTDKDNNNAAEDVHSASESDEDFVKQLTTTQEIEGNSEEDTVDKAYKDLMSDIDRLHGTWKKLSDNDEISEDLDSAEQKAVSESEDYEEISDDELEKIFNSASDEENEDKIDLSDEKPTKDAPEQPKIHKVLPYIDDALIASDDKEILPTSTDSISEEVSASTPIQEPLVQAVKSTPGPSNKMIIAEEDKLINEFVKEQKSVYDISASDVRNAINIRLTIDTPVEVTSPEYPSPYPTDNTVDWMFTGDGMGIELNITDFSINGHLGDYLLVKPGGVDESGSTGLIFTYTLRTERRYRFLDVDKMFVRFVANRGNRFMRGFKFSARMVVPRPGGLIEPEPEPEPGMPDPPATITLNLGGISLKNFMDVEEEFRHIIADMATLYINTKGIDPGLNTTLEAAQITSRALCFHNWPKFELCTEVQFGVPIVYDVERNVTDARLNADDLLDMWTYYSQRDPFAVRLRILGITEYQVPDDASVVTLWLVVAGGVVISAALLALALWRFSCFEDYTRMPVYGDADSVAEKRTLDLYPTPHQTLPPLYTETDYKWADDNFDTDKVDMSFSNKTFLREDPFEGPGAPRDRNFSFSPRDIYDVDEASYYSMDSPCGCRAHRVARRGAQTMPGTCDPGVGLRAPLLCADTLTFTVHAPLPT